MTLTKKKFFWHRSKILSRFIMTIHILVHFYNFYRYLKLKLGYLDQSWMQMFQGSLGIPTSQKCTGHSSLVFKKTLFIIFK